MFHGQHFMLYTEPLKFNFIMKNYIAQPVSFKNRQLFMQIDKQKWSPYEFQKATDHIVFIIFKGAIPPGIVISRLLH